MIATEFDDIIAERIRVEHQALAARWFERLLDLLPVDARDIFPSDSLLDHVPAIIVEIGNYLKQPSEGAIAANTSILDKARELGALRHSQRASLHQLLREYQLLGRVLVSFVLEEMERLDVVPNPTESARLISRLHQAVDVLSQSTVETFVSLYTKTILEQSERLDLFTRMAAHEWRQPLDALRVGLTLLKRERASTSQSAQIFETVARSVTHLIDLTQKLERVARINNPTDNPVLQRVSAATVINEAARQLREMADARGVSVLVADTLPTLTVDVARLELTIINLLSNAIKYSDPAKTVRFVEVRGEEDEEQVRLLVHDNGIGISAESQTSIFRRFSRVQPTRTDLQPIPGVGLGLSIVEDCVRAMKGRIEVQSAEGTGTTFVVTLPTHPAAERTG